MVSAKGLVVLLIMMTKTSFFSLFFQYSLNISIAYFEKKKNIYTTLKITSLFENAKPIKAKVGFSTHIHETRIAESMPERVLSVNNLIMTATKAL